VAQFCPAFGREMIFSFNDRRMRRTNPRGRPAIGTTMLPIRLKEVIWPMPKRLSGLKEER
jgi:hypothetical protein